MTIFSKRMDRLAAHVKTFCEWPVVHLKMIFSEDFRKLLTVCLKMLFRKSTRKRFICLVITFLCMMSFNTCSYVNKFHKTETQKKKLMDEKAFKVFFLRMRTRNTFERYLVGHNQKLKDLGSDLVKNAFIYQNNLFIHFLTPTENQDKEKTPEYAAMNLLYEMYNIREFANNFYVRDYSGDDYLKVRNNYLDYNGARLNEDVIASRHAALKFDLIDIADMIRENIWDKRIDIYNSIKR
ncbi:MAG: hypothetical protein KKH68_09035, partial [Proteobacteria bacterium]|nr:hypothetical protein [Pseudomonadota bacterium]